MSAASDKARFYLEQSVPELKEFERKKIFNRGEINSIAKKRSDFEHKINARGSTPTDFAKYAEFEINVDALRKKRVKRLGIKTTTHDGQRRIFFVFDRGTRKHPGDVGLWLQSIDYARKQKAYKKVSQIFTSMLRLHPSKPDLWILAAQFAMEDHADMTEARGYMQRGLRFCKNQKSIWLEYARLEMSYMAKIHARRQILGIGGPSHQDIRSETEQANDSENVLLLPKLTIEDIDVEVKDKEVDEVALKKLESTPVLAGAIPIAVFDAAMAQFKDDPLLGYQFFDMVYDYGQLQATPDILRHIQIHLLESERDQWAAQVCHVRFPLVNVDINSVAFPAAFRTFLERYKTARKELGHNDRFMQAIRAWLDRMKDEESLDPSIKTIIQSLLASVASSGIA